jgi:predicted PurR-regulated permease PerM
MLATLAGIGALYLARALCIPLAVALLLSALLRPIVRRLERWRVSTHSRRSRTLDRTEGYHENRV